MIARLFSTARIRLDHHKDCTNSRVVVLSETADIFLMMMMIMMVKRESKCRADVVLRDQIDVDDDDYVGDEDNDYDDDVRWAHSIQVWLEAR